MASYNRIIMMGNLTRDPQLTYLPSQTPVVEFGLASNRKWRAKDGTDRDETCFIDCRAYGKPAETISKYCKKGRSLLVEGRLTLDQWESPDGQKHSKHRIFVENFTFTDSRSSEGGQAAPAARGGGNAAPAPMDDFGPAPDDDIPF